MRLVRPSVQPRLHLSFVSWGAYLTKDGQRRAHLLTGAALVAILAPACVGGAQAQVRPSHLREQPRTLQMHLALFQVAHR